jgi:hypothetical protein
MRLKEEIDMRKSFGFGVCVCVSGLLRNKKNGRMLPTLTARAGRRTLGKNFFDSQILSRGVIL